MYELDPEGYKILESEYFDDVVMQGLKGIYGTGDAPLLWRLELHDFMFAAGFTQSRFDECMYMRRNAATKVVECLVTVRVDDLECAGTTEELLNFKRQITKRFGYIKEQRDSFKHCGIEYSQSKDNKVVKHSQKTFIDQIPYATVPGRSSSRPKTPPCTEDEHRQYRSGTGACLWALKTRLDAASEVCSPQSKAASPTVGDLTELNEVIRLLRDSSNQTLNFHSIGPGPYRIILMSDASFNKREDPKSRSVLGWIVMLAKETGKDTLDGPVHILNWGSRRSPRVTKSTLSAEALGLTAGLEDAIKFMCWYSEITSSKVLTTLELRDMQEKGGAPIKIDSLIDAKSLLDSVTSFTEPRPSDSGCLLWLRWIRERLEADVVRAVGWISTQGMFADVLTKPNSPVVPRLRKLMETGVLGTQYAAILGGRPLDTWKGFPAPKSQKKPSSVQFVAQLGKVSHVFQQEEAIWNLFSQFR